MFYDLLQTIRCPKIVALLPFALLINHVDFFRRIFLTGISVIIGKKAFLCRELIHPLYQILIPIGCMIRTRRLRLGNQSSPSWINAKAFGLDLLPYTLCSGEKSILHNSLIVMYSNYAWKSAKYITFLIWTYLFSKAFTPSTSPKFIPTFQLFFFSLLTFFIPLYWTFNFLLRHLFTSLSPGWFISFMRSITQSFILFYFIDPAPFFWWLMFEFTSCLNMVIKIS